MPRVDDVMLMAYVDGEVDAASAREIERAIASDPVVAARARAFRDTATLSRAAYVDALHEPVPDRLIAALGVAAPVATAPAAANVVTMQPRTRPVRQLVGWAMAASLAAIVVAGYGGVEYGKRASRIPTGMEVVSADRWLSNVVEYYNVYAKNLAEKDRLLVDFNAENIPELENWFGARLNRKLAVPDLSSFGLAPQGGRLVILNNKPAAQFVYYSEQGELVTLVIAQNEQPQMYAQFANRGEVNIVHWRKNGYAYALVGKLEIEKLHKIADSAWHALDTI
jgi:anti-sigma factor RsiW